MSGRVHPDGDAENMYCDSCREETLFIKKWGVKRNFVFWIPLSTKEKEGVYWECSQCNSFVRFEDPGNSYVNLPGDKGGIMRDLSKKEKDCHLSESLRALKKFQDRKNI